MKEIKSGERIFYVENDTVGVYNQQHQLVRVYPAGIEKLFVEKGIKISQIQKAMMERKEASYLNWVNRFQISEGQVEFEEKQKQVPGILIRYDDSVDFHAKHPIPKGEGLDVYIAGILRLAHLSEYIWGELNMSDVRSPKIYFAFNSRNNMPLHSNALSAKRNASKLEKEVKRLFREFLMKEQGIIFEALTDQGLVPYSPDLVLLRNGLRKGVNVGLSQYKLTSLAVSSFIYDRLKQSTGAIRKQFKARERDFAERVEFVKGIAEAFKTDNPEEMLELADRLLEEAERFQELLIELDKE